jgi:hypothetical protein
MTQLQQIAGYFNPGHPFLSQEIAKTNGMSFWSKGQFFDFQAVTNKNIFDKSRSLSACKLIPLSFHAQIHINSCYLILMDITTKYTQKKEGIA